MSRPARWREHVRRSATVATPGISAGALLCWLTLCLAGQARGAETAALESDWQGPGVHEALPSWSREAFDGLRKASPAAKRTQERQHGAGVVLSAFIERELAGLPLEKRAQVDLVVLTQRNGAKVLLPRFVATKYPLAFLLTGDRGFAISVPKSALAKIQGEGLSGERYEVSGLTRIDFANYHERYGSLYLKRRTDPVAMRGEKHYVQGCMGCHAVGNGPELAPLAADARARALASSDSHPAVRGMAPLNARERMAVRAYLEAYRGENTAVAGAPTR